MENINVQVTQTSQPVLTVEIVQNLVPVMTAQVVIGGAGQEITFGDTLTGAGTPTDPVNVSNDVLQQISDNTEQGEQNASQIADIQNAVQSATEQISEIQSVIPATATAQNQLADQGFVNSSIQTATAYFRGDWATWADVPTDPAQYPADATGNRTPITNDYMVVIADEQENGGTWRYKYTGVWAAEGKSGWQAEYQVNETPFTAAQNAAINSGVTAQAVADISANKTAVTNLQTSKQNKLTAGDNITIVDNVISATGGGTALPDQTGNAGKFLITDGTGVSWGNVIKDGLTISWSGKYMNTRTAILRGSYYRTDNNSTYDIDIMYCDGLANVEFFGRVDIGLLSPRDIRSSTIGNGNLVWGSVYTDKLNAGIFNGVPSGDLIVPTEGGTLARIEDIDAAVGDISTALTAILGE